MVMVMKRKGRNFMQLLLLWSVDTQLFWLFFLEVLLFKIKLLKSWLYISSEKLQIQSRKQNISLSWLMKSQIFRIESNL